MTYAEDLRGHVEFHLDFAEKDQPDFYIVYHTGNMRGAGVHISGPFKPHHFTFHYGGDDATLYTVEVIRDGATIHFDADFIAGFFQAEVGSVVSIFGTPADAVRRE